MREPRSEWISLAPQSRVAGIPYLTVPPTNAAMLLHKCFVDVSSIEACLLLQATIGRLVHVMLSPGLRS